MDAGAKGSVARFVNHSRTPNVAIKVFFDGQILRLALVCLRDIQTGEEVTLNYGHEYWQQRQEIKR